MTKAARVVPKQTLHNTVSRIFSAAGCSHAHSDIVADVLLWANLRGVDSHGVARVPRYIELFESAADATAGAIKELPAASENAEVLLPGERGGRTLELRSREGIPVPQKVWEALIEAAQAVGVDIDD